MVTTNPTFRTMCEEIFGPVITIYVYEPKDWHKTLQLVDATSEYALTGAIFSTDRYAIEEASKALENAAGNFYINDNPRVLLWVNSHLVALEDLELMTKLAQY